MWGTKAHLWLILLESSSTDRPWLFLKFLFIKSFLCLQWNSPSVLEMTITIKFNYCFPLWILRSRGPFELVVNLRLWETMTLQLFTGYFQFSHHINLVPINYLLIKANIINVLSVAIYYPQHGSFSKCFLAHFIEMKKRKKKQLIVWLQALKITDSC